MRDVETSEAPQQSGVIVHAVEWRTDSSDRSQRTARLLASALTDAVQRDE